MCGDGVNDAPALRQAQTGIAVSTATDAGSSVVLARPRFSEMRMLTFTVLVFTGQANTYVLRTKRPFWLSRPAGVMLLASLADVTLVAVLATSGLLMKPLTPDLLVTLLVATVGFAVAMDALKRVRFSRLEIDRRRI